MSVLKQDKEVFIVFSQEDVFGVFAKYSLAEKMRDTVNDMYSQIGSYMKAEIKSLAIIEPEEI